MIRQTRLAISQTVSFFSELFTSSLVQLFAAAALVSLVRAASLISSIPNNSTAVSALLCAQTLSFFSHLKALHKGALIQSCALKLDEVSEESTMAVNIVFSPKFLSVVVARCCIHL